MLTQDVHVAKLKNHLFGYFKLKWTYLRIDRLSIHENQFSSTLLKYNNNIIARMIGNLTSICRMGMELKHPLMIYLAPIHIHQKLSFSSICASWSSAGSWSNVEVIFMYTGFDAPLQTCVCQAHYISALLSYSAASMRVCARAFVCVHLCISLCLFNRK